MPTPPCRRCLQPHPIEQCPHVKALEYDPRSGAITRVEFLTPADYRAAPPAPSPSPTPIDGPDYAKLGD